MTFSFEGKVLAIEDDPNIQEALKQVAAELGLTLEGAFDGKRGLALAEKNDYSLIILDLGLPSIGGAEICRQLRAKKPKLPIVILTSKTDELNTVLGLELGADDYVTKPFRMAELVARLRTLYRRIHAYAGTESARSPVMTAGDLTIDIEKREASRAGQPLALTRTEFDLLAYFFLNADVVLKRDELIENVWGYNCSSFDGTVTTYLSRLRQKIGDDPNKPRRITTVRGVGYRFVVSDPES